MTKIRYRAFGGDNLPTIYYMGGYGGRIRNYRPHIYSLVFSGYRVVAFEYDNSVLASGDPQTLIDTLNDAEAVIHEDRQNRVVAGLYGVSLGTWFSQNIMKDFGIERGVYNSAVSNLVDAIWNNPNLKKEKQSCIDTGISRSEHERHWQPYDMRLKQNKFAGKKLLVMNSGADQVVDINEVRRTVKDWRSHGSDVTFIEVYWLSHALSIAWNYFRIRRVARFFSETPSN